MTYRLNGEKGVLMKNFKDILSHKPSNFASELMRDALISYGVKRAMDDVYLFGVCVKELSRIHPIKKKGGEKKESQ